MLSVAKHELNNPKRLKSKGRSRSKYTGKLREPIYEPVSVGGILGDVGGRMQEQARERAAQRVKAKFFELMEWYDIDPESEDRWFLLAVELAIQHVPGMCIIYETQPRRGRKSSWKTGLAIELLRSIEALQQQREGLSITEAIAKLRQDKAGKWSRYTRENLEARHREARRDERRRRDIVQVLMRPTPTANALMRSNVPMGGLLGGLFGIGKAATETDENS
jgi:hypothetical protein